MKKLATGLVGLATLLLILSGCTKKPEPSKTTSSKEKVKTSQSSTKTSKPKVTLTDKELVAAVYIESYMAQHSIKDIPTAVNEILKQPKFMINGSGGTLLANQEPVLVNGDLGTTSTITDDKIHVQSYNGNEHFSDKYYYAKELTSKYSTHVDLLKKVVALSDKHTAELHSLTDEELALAAYVRNYATTDTEISSYLTEGLANSDFSVEFKDNSYRFGQGTVSSTEEITVSGNQVVCVTHNGATETDTVNYTKDELTKIFVQYKTLLEGKLELGKQNSTKVNTPSTVDTTKLTEEQAVKWMKDNMGSVLDNTYNTDDNIQNHNGISFTADDFSYERGDLGDDGALYYNVYEDHQSDNMKSADADPMSHPRACSFRITSDGVLQLQTMEDMVNDDWQTVSTTYPYSE